MDSESGPDRFEFSDVAVFESADDAGQGTVCGGCFRMADYPLGTPQDRVSGQ